MRTSMVLTLLFVSALAACSSSKPEEAPLVRTNFNLGAAPQNPDYPQGKNGETEDGAGLASLLPAHNPAICFGQSCVCTAPSKAKKN